MTGGDVRVSVVIPAFNVEPWLGGAIASVVDQDPAPAEIIVVDDGSSDDTGVVARRFPRVTVIRQENRGLAGARNTGAAAATGDALLFLDADDALVPGAIREMASVLDGHDSLGAVVPNFVVVEGGRARTAWSGAPTLRVLERADLRRLLRANPLAANALVRREVWQSLRFREELRAAEDLDLWLRLLLSGLSIAMLGTPLVRVRGRRAGALTSRTSLMRRSRRSVFASLWARPELTLQERGLVAYQLARTSVGVLVAPAECPSPTRPRCVHVFPMEPGGGPTHVRILRDGLGERVEWHECALDPRDLARPGVGFLRATIAVAKAAKPGLILHAHGVRAAAAAVPAALLRRVPLVVTVHGLHAMRRSPGIITRMSNKAVLHRARRVLVLSKSDRATVVRARLVPAERVVFVRAACRAPQRVDRACARRALDLPPKILVVSWIGRLSPEKDPLTFCRAVRALGERRRVVGVIAGDGPLRLDVRRELDLGHVRALRAPGWVDDPATLLAASDVFVSTSRWEGLPLAALEAALAGLPLVLTDVPGNRDLVDAGVPAILVPPGDPAAIAAAIVGLRPQVRARMGEEAAEVVHRLFTAEGLAEDVLRVYRGFALRPGDPR